MMETLSDLLLAALPSVKNKGDPITDDLSHDELVSSDEADNLGMIVPEFRSGKIISGKP